MVDDEILEERLLLRTQLAGEELDQFRGLGIYRDADLLAVGLCWLLNSSTRFQWPKSPK